MTEKRPLYRFRLRRIERDSTGYYYPRWDRATPMTVEASTQDEAIDKARALSPKLKYGWHWEFAVDSIAEADRSEQ